MTKCENCNCKVPEEATEKTNRGRHVREYYHCECGKIGNHKIDLIPNVKRK